MAFVPQRVLREYGLTVGQVALALRTSIEGTVPGVYCEAGDERDIRVRLVESARASTGQLASLHIRTAVGLAGAGSFFRKPMAVVTMGGVLGSAVFTLLLIPVLYDRLDRIGAAVRRKVVELETGEHPTPRKARSG